MTFSSCLANPLSDRVWNITLLNFQFWQPLSYFLLCVKLSWIIFFKSPHTDVVSKITKKEKWQLLPEDPGDKWIPQNRRTYCVESYIHFFPKKKPSIFEIIYSSLGEIEDRPKREAWKVLFVTFLKTFYVPEIVQREKKYLILCWKIPVILGITAFVEG